MATLSGTDCRRFLELEAERLAQTDDSDLGLEIPHIDGWTVQSVIGHTGWVYRYVDAALQATPDDPPSRSAVPEPPTSEGVVAWLAEGAEALMARFDQIDLDEIHPTFTGPQPGHWWLRRIAQESAMHRWDVQSARGKPDAIDPALAKDGIDEVLEVFTPARMQFPTLNGAGETVHLHATDIDDGEWVLTYQADSVAWEHNHTKADVAARGPVEDLLLLVWSRIPPSRLEIFGDSTLLDRWQEAATF